MTVLSTPSSTKDRHDDADPSTRPVRILAICDEVDPRLYSPGIEARRGQVDLVLSCGDLPAYYLDFVASMLNVPLYGVHGNHDGSLNHRKDEDGRGD